MTPAVSVIIPVYNGERMVERALQSVLAQTYPAHEIIVIDDGSTDGTPEVLKKYAGRIIMRRIPNSGPALARNEGLRLATGDAVAFLDHDDIWFKNKLEAQAAALRQYPQAGFVCCDFAVRYPYMNYRLVKHFSVLSNLRQMNFDAPLKENPFKLLIIEHFVGTSSNVVIRKEVIDRVGFFNPKYKSSQDYEYWLRCAAVTDFVVMSEVLLYKKNHPSNISANFKRTQSFRRQVLTDTIASQQTLIRRLGIAHVCAMSVAACDYYRGNLEFESGGPREAFRLYWGALRGYPHPANLTRFLWTLSKKSARLLTFGLLRRKDREKYRNEPGTDGKDPKISVIIPSYNGVGMLEKAIECVLAQDRPAHEIIVIDDGSTDGTHKIMERYAGRIVARRTPNGGVSAARNEGIRLATGDWVAFLDHDDVWFEHRLSRVAEMIRRYPGVGFICSNYAVRYPYLGNRLVRHFSALKNARELNFDEPLKKNPFYLVVKEYFIGTASSMVVKKEVIDRVGPFDVSNKRSQDLEFSLRCAVATDFLALSEVSFYKKTHPSNLSSDALETLIDHKDALVKNMAQNKEYIQKHRLAAAVSAALADLEYQIGNDYFETGRTQEAFESYRRALAVRPTPANALRYAWAGIKKSARLALGAGGRKRRSAS